ncbi:MAG: cyclase family protein, partial [Anaerolineae bacterium]
MIYDITRTISPQLAVWPGDTPFSFTQQASLAEGDSVNLTTLNMSAHTGTHIDAPWHFQQVDMHPADLPLEPYIGPAHVVSVVWETGGLTPEHVAGIQADRIERLLV